MGSFGKGSFGSGIEFTTEIVNGKCPSCNHFGVLISLDPSYFRCTTCGHDLEQKIKPSPVPYISYNSVFY